MCDQAAWTMWGLSMAGYNALIVSGASSPPFSGGRLV